MAEQTSTNFNSNNDNSHQDSPQFDSNTENGQQPVDLDRKSVADDVTRKYVTTADEVNSIIEHAVLSGDESEEQNYDNEKQPEQGINENTEQQQLPEPPAAQSQTHLVTTVDNESQVQKKKHIMISYNRGSCMKVCKKIDASLRRKGYKVWRDTRCLHGNILDGMAKAVEESFIILLCINKKYQQSNYCMIEAKYAFERKIAYIPCLMEENFEPTGALALIKSDKKHIPFFSAKDYGASFQELLAEIEHIEEQLKQRSNISHSMTDADIDNFIGTMNSRSGLEDDVELTNRINTIISEYKESIDKAHLQLKSLNKKELFDLMERLCQEISPDTLQIFRSENSNIDDENSDDSSPEPERFYDWVMTYLMNQDARLTEIIRTQQLQENNLTRITQCVLNHSDQMLQMVKVQQQQQECFRQLSEQVQGQQEVIRQLSIRQAQQEAENQTLFQTLQTQSSQVESTNRQISERTTTDKREKRHDYLNTLISLANTAILIWTMGTLAKRP